MKNKYFTPDIENIHIGYECESLGTEWHPITISLLSFVEPSWLIQKDEKPKTILDHLTDKKLRVPYLTKEQIEAEKWEYLSEGYIGHQSFYKDDFEMSCFYDKHLLKIIKKEKVKTVVLYQGRCKCINEFKKIIKLLEI
jgi:hypothetical protein